MPERQLKTKKERGTKIDILSFFYKYPIKSLPVVDKGKNIKGILLKDSLIASSSITSNLTTPLTKVISNHLIPVILEKDYQILQGLLQNFKKVKTIPVIDVKGRVVDYWNRFDLICAWEGYPDLALQHFETLFSNFPYPVVVVDSKLKITYINLAGSELVITGRGRRIIGKYLLEIFPPLKSISNSSIINEPILIEGEEFTYDGVPIKKADETIGAIYLLRRKG
jgi:PAS domain-containing protein